MNFKKWLEVGMGGGGVGSGMVAPLQSPTTNPGAFADYHSGPDNPELPPLSPKKRKLKRMNKK